MKLSFEFSVLLHRNVTHVGMHCINNVISGHADVIHNGTVSLLLYCPRH
jgi:hypothetical protein